MNEHAIAVQWWIRWSVLYLEAITPINGRVPKGLRVDALRRHMKSAHTRAFWRADMALAYRFRRETRALVKDSL